jgi:hypothetical protein
MTSAERALLVARVLEQHPHLAELVPLRLRAVAEAEEGYPLKAEWSTGTPTRPLPRKAWSSARYSQCQGSS